MFLEKVEKLKKLMIEIKSFHSIACPVFETIVSKLGKLSDSVKKDNICLNAGGKFEWVDSTLVKVSFCRKLINEIYVNLFVVV